MNPFFFLLLAHLLLDYPLQGDFMAMMKGKNNFILITHCALWSLGIGAVLTYFGLYTSWQLWWLFFGHLAMDYVKSRGHLARFIAWAWPCDCPAWATDPLGLPLWIDQGWHVFQLIVCLAGLAAF